MNLVRQTLENGLRVVVLELPHVHSVELGLFVKAGPRFEDTRTLGISHFTEHMLFKGTRSRPGTFRLHADVERLGSPINALTSRDYCQYYFHLPARNLERATELFADIMQHPAFDNIDTERQIIVEEHLGDLNEAGEDITPESHSRALLWPDSPLGLNILGTRANILRFNRQDLLNHHQKHYTGHNCVLYFAGAVTAAQSLLLAKRFFGSLPPGEPLVVPRVVPLPQGPRFKFVDNEDSQAHLNLSFLTPPMGTPEHLTLAVLYNLLADGISSRLQWHICEKLGMVYDLDAGLEGFFDTGVFDIDASVAHERLVPLARELLSVLDGLRSTPVESDELQKAVDRYRMSYEFALDSPGALASWMISSELYSPPISVEACMAHMDALTPQHLQALARQMFQPGRMVMVVSGHPTRQEKQRLMKLIDTFGKG